MSMIAIWMMLLAAVTSSVRAQRPYPPYQPVYNSAPPPPPPVVFRGHATLLSPAEAHAAQAAAAYAAGGRGPPPPLPLRVSAPGYSFGGPGAGGGPGAASDGRGTAFDGENYLYDGRAANPNAHSGPLSHASLITRYQPVHDLPVENRPKILVPTPYEKYIKADSASPYSAERYTAASSTSPSYVDRPVNLISPMVYGYSYGSKYNNQLAGLPALQLAARGAEPGFYGKRPDFPGVKAARSLTSRGDLGHYKDTPILGFYKS